MTRAILIWTAVIAWALLFAMSGVTGLTMAPEGDGFTRGMNRLQAVAAWQAGALVAAIVGLIVGHGATTPGMRMLARAPILVELALALVIAGLVIYTLISGA
jgi:hypothetical protein